MAELFQHRKEYHQKVLTRESLRGNPVEQFQTWLGEAVQMKLEEPNAMVLATVGKDNHPSARIVLLKQFDDSGFTFFTNYESRKGGDISINPFASLLFPWYTMERQIRIEGKVEKVTESESDAYFKERPIGNQVSALISLQSRVIPSRYYLEKLEKKIKEEYRDKPIPRPSNWGGYRLIPDRFEFWQGRKNRLHDRFEYYIKDEGWKIRRLAP